MEKNIKHYCIEIQTSDVEDVMSTFNDDDFLDKIFGARSIIEYSDTIPEPEGHLVITYDLYIDDKSYGDIDLEALNDEFPEAVISIY